MQTHFSLLCFGLNSTVVWRDTFIYSAKKLNLYFFVRIFTLFSVLFLVVGFSLENALFSPLLDVLFLFFHQSKLVWCGLIWYLQPHQSTLEFQKLLPAFPPLDSLNAKTDMFAVHTTLCYPSSKTSGRRQTIITYGMLALATDTRDNHVQEDGNSVHSKT